MKLSELEWYTITLDLYDLIFGDEFTNDDLIDYINNVIDEFNDSVFDSTDCVLRR